MDFAAREPHFLDHLAPVRWALSEDRRGAFHIPKSLAGRAAKYGIKATQKPLLFDNRPVLVASLGDLKSAVKAKRRVFLMEHGAGQSYSSSHASYSGGRSPERERVSFFLVPNEWAAERNRRAYPQARVEVIGCPKLDPWANRKWVPNKVPVVAFGFHWDARVAPESRWAFPHYAKALPPLSKSFRLIGHSHPRAWRVLKGFYERMGIEAVENFDEVLERADLYACDNSSTLFEFAATGRPVVVLNAPWYRRTARHGLRFWDCATVGLQCDVPTGLEKVIERALSDPEEVRRGRERITKLVYPHMGSSAARAARFVEEALNE